MGMALECTLHGHGTRCVHRMNMELDVYTVWTWNSMCTLYGHEARCVHCTAVYSVAYCRNECAMDDNCGWTILPQLFHAVPA